MAVSLRNQAAGTKVNFVTAMAVANRTRFNGFIFQGEVGYAVAKLAADLVTLVAATKAYFRTGSSTDPTAIAYIMVKQSESSPMVVIPEPLIDLNSVEVAGNVRRIVTVYDDITEQQLNQILVGNNLTNFSITTEQL